MNSRLFKPCALASKRLHLIWKSWILVNYSNTHIDHKCCAFQIGFTCGIISACYEFPFHIMSTPQSIILSWFFATISTRCSFCVMANLAASFARGAHRPKRLLADAGALAFYFNFVSRPPPYLSQRTTNLYTRGALHINRSRAHREPKIMTKNGAQEH